MSGRRVSSKTAACVFVCVFKDSIVYKLALVALSHCAVIMLRIIDVFTAQEDE